MRLYRSTKCKKYRQILGYTFNLKRYRWTTFEFSSFFLAGCIRESNEIKYLQKFDGTSAKMFLWKNSQVNNLYLVTNKRSSVCAIVLTLLPFHKFTSLTEYKYLNNFLNSAYGTERNLEHSVKVLQRNATDLAKNEENIEPS